MSRMATLQSAPTLSVRTILVYLGLGQPSARAFVAAVLAASISYAAQMPREAWDEEGRIRPFAPLSPGPDGVTLKHFLVAPVVAGTVAYLFT